MIAAATVQSRPDPQRRRPAHRACSATRRSCIAGLSALGSETGPPTSARSSQGCRIRSASRRRDLLARSVGRGRLQRGEHLALLPATPFGYSLLRASLCAAHTEAQIDEVIGIFRDGRHRPWLGSTHRASAPLARYIQRLRTPPRRRASRKIRSPPSGGRRRSASVTATRSRRNARADLGHGVVEPSGVSECRLHQPQRVDELSPRPTDGPRQLRKAWLCVARPGMNNPQCILQHTEDRCTSPPRNAAAAEAIKCPSPGHAPRGRAAPAA